MTKPKILIVDDRPQNLFTLAKLLAKVDAEVLQATSGAKALQLVLDHDFSLAIVDVQMPEMDGYELVELLRGNEETATLPVIFVSAIYSDEYHHRKGYDAGAVDFMSKPFIPDILLSKVRVFLELYQQRRKLQSLVDELNTANAQLSRYAMQLETNAQVSHQITSILGQESLLPQIIDLIQSRFGYYFVGVWLVNAQEHRVVLLAASRYDGEPSLEPGYSLPLDGDKGLIPHVCRSAERYLLDDVCTDEHYIALKELPDTCSELVLPLRIGQQVLGALDIQSEAIAAFSAEDVTALHSLADQIAIAIRNAQLYEGLEELVRERTAELQKAYHLLEHLDRNKSEFIQVVSHELRTPLTLVKGFSQMLLNHALAASDTKLQQGLEGIANGAERMHTIVNSMLDMIKIDNETLAMNLEPVTIAPLFETVRKAYASALENRRLTLALEALDALPQVQGDREALYKVFDHLVSNAIKYTPDGGSITVTGQTQRTDTGVSVEIVVSDQGIGIHSEAQELIFEKFYRTGEVALHSSGKTKFKGGGAGLGLSIARGLVLAHGGQIWVESPGHDEERCPGSQFHVLLPGYA